MWLSDRNRFVQVYRENDYINIYYDRKEQIYLKYKKDNKVKFSWKFQMGIVITLYLGQMINEWCCEVLKEIKWIKIFLIFAVFIVGVFALFTFECYVAKIVKKEGRFVSQKISSDELELGKIQFGKQKIIICACFIAAMFMLLLFIKTNAILLWFLFTISWLCLTGMMASVRPYMKKKMYCILDSI